MAPALYGWSMRRRIFRLYGELKYIETELENAGGIPASGLLTQLQRLEERANRLQLPFAFAPFLYQLRNHIALVRARIQGVASGAAAPAAQRAAAAAGTSSASLAQP
jgi:hypothetical protein